MIITWVQIFLFIILFLLGIACFVSNIINERLLNSVERLRAERKDCVTVLRAAQRYLKHEFADKNPEEFRFIEDMIIRLNRL